MSARVHIRPAVREDLEDLARLRQQAILHTSQSDYSSQQLHQWAAVNPEARTQRRVAEGCVLIACIKHHIIACNSLDLEAAEMVGLFVLPEFQHMGVARRLVAAIERLAVQFGMLSLNVEAAQPAVGFYRACRYSVRSGAQWHPDSRTGLECLAMARQFPQRQTRLGAQICQIQDELGIDRDYGQKHRLRIQGECRELATIGTDVFGREQMLRPSAARAWYALRNAAQSDEVTLEVVSAFRSIDYQAGIIRRKLAAGQAIADILKVSAAPGFSEHHSGTAVDISSPGSEPLEETFERTEAFEWLTACADQHGFFLSYPRNNRHGIAYEPWHWAWRRTRAGSADRVDD